MLFHERWIGESQLSKTVELAASTNDLQGEVIEVGVHQGLSAIPIANAVYPGILHAVDCWDWQAVLDNDERYNPLDHAGSLARIHLQQETVSRDNYQIFQDNVSEGTHGNVSIWKMGWREFAEQWREPVRFLHIDAAHTADEVADNIGAFLPYAVEGAIFCGDDYLHPPVAEGVARKFSKVHAGPAALWWVRI